VVADVADGIGRAIQLDVLDAQNILAQARLRYAQAVVRYNQSQVRLFSALGLLDAACLAGG
jgi:outer membrane protein TolC